MGILSGIPKVVRVFNRVVDEHGARVPQSAHFDGDSVTIHDYVDAPFHVAQVFVHQSMYRIDPLTNRADYKLGVREFGLPTDDLSVADIPDELIDRASLPGKVERRYIRNPIVRTEPLSATHPGRGDGAFPGSYGERA